MTRRTVALCACPRSIVANRKIVASSIAAARRARRFLSLIIEFSSCATPSRAHCRPLLDDAGKRVEAVGQRRRTGLQNEWRLDLAQEAVAHCRNLSESRPRRDLGRHEFLAAPGADDDVGI